MSEILNNNNSHVETVISGGYFEFDDGGCYAGDWVNGQAYGYGKCTGPQGKGEYAGTWKSGFEVLGIYTWPNGNTYEGEWLEGKRGGVGVETKGNWIYKGEWTQGLKGKYGIRLNLLTEAKYEGSWISGMQEGLGVETYIDESTYQGQWSKGMRHGFGIRKSVPRGIAAIYKSSGSTSSLRPSASLPSVSNKQTSSLSSQDGMYGSTLDNRKHDDSDRDRGGFVLVEKTKPTVTSHQSLQRSKSFNLGRTLSKRFKAKNSDSSINGNNKLNHLSNAAFSSDPSNLCGSADTGRNSLLACSVDVNLASVIEMYSGEWKNDKRCGFGISQRSDGLRYEGEWFNDKRCGYGVTVFKDGTREEGKYRNNELITSLNRKSKIFSKKKVKDRVEVSVGFAKKAFDNANQKSEMALAKRRTAVSKALLADEAAKRARYFADIARKHARKFEITTTEDIAMNEADMQEKRIEGNKSKKSINRGESGDSQMSSWSGSSLPSTKKNVSEPLIHDTVFLNFEVKEQNNLTDIKSKTSKINTFDFDVNKVQIAKQASTDSSKLKSPLKSSTTQSDMRDYFSDSGPEITSNENERISNNQLFRKESIPVISSKEVRINTREGIMSQAHSETDRFYPKNSMNINNNNTNSNHSSTIQELRRRFSSTAKSQVTDEGQVIQNSRLPPSNKTSNLILYGKKYDGFLSKNSSSLEASSSPPPPPPPPPLFPPLPDNDAIHLMKDDNPKPNSDNSDIQRWWHQNSLTIMFVVINFILMIIFFGLWSSRD